MVGRKFSYKLKDISSNNSGITGVVVMVMMKNYIVVASVDDDY